MYLRETSYQVLECTFLFAGMFIYNNGDIYEGVFSDGCKCGKGKGLSGDVCDFKYKEI